MTVTLKSINRGGLAMDIKSWMKTAGLKFPLEIEVFDEPFIVNSIVTDTVTRIKSGPLKGLDVNSFKYEK